MKYYLICLIFLFSFGESVFPLSISAKNKRKKPLSAKNKVINSLKKKTRVKNKIREFYLDILFPSLFKDSNISDKIKLYSDDTKKACENVAYSEKNRRLYRFKCPKSKTYTLTVNGFLPAEIKNPKTGKAVDLALSDLNFKVLISDTPGSLFSYWFDGKKIKSCKRQNAGCIEELTLSLEKAKNGFKFSAMSPDGSEKYTDCNIDTEFSMDNIMKDKPVELSSDCVTNRIIWHKEWKIPADIMTGCITYKIGKGELICLRLKKDDDITLTWGDAWEDINIQVKNLGSLPFKITLDSFIPAWPLKKDDPWLQDASFDGEQCEAAPAYTPLSVWYCPDDKFSKDECKKGKLSKGGENFLLPDLGKTEWNDKGPLPSYFFLEFKKTSPNPRYKEKLRTVFPFSLTDREESILLEDRFDNIYAVFPVNIPEKPDVPYDHSSMLLIFNEKSECMSLSEGLYNPVGSSVFKPDDIKNITTHACTWAKVVKGEHDVSICAQGEKQEQKVNFNLIPNIIKGPRQVIVIANSDLLGREGRGAAIQHSIIAWLYDLKESKKPFNLITIDGDGTIAQVLRGEELARFIPANNNNSLHPTVEGEISSKIIFNAKGFKPLKDLESLEYQLGSLGLQDIEKVLYFHDSSMPEKIFNADLGTPLGWARAGVHLKIVTDGECTMWEERTDAECIKLAKHPEEGVIKTIFENF